MSPFDLPTLPVGYFSNLRARSLFALSTILLSSSAGAQSAAPGAGPSPLVNAVVPFVVMFAIMYFLIIRPQAQKQKTHQDFLLGLKKGDEVLTSGGLLGRIEGLTDLFVTLEVAPNVRIKVVRSQIASYVPSPVTATNEVKA